MKTLRYIPIACVAFALIGCGKKEAPSSASAPAPKPAVEAPAGPAAEKAPVAARTVVVTASDTMKFDVTKIEAKAGEMLTIKLVNAGTQPKDAMGHNLVLLKLKADAGAFATAAMQAKATEYIPSSMKDNIVAHTKLLGPKQEDSFTITVPAEPGEYPFLCSFPAHYLVGMKGVLVVK